MIWPKWFTNLFPKHLDRSEKRKAFVRQQVMLRLQQLHIKKLMMERVNDGRAIREARIRRTKRAQKNGAVGSVMFAGWVTDASVIDFDDFTPEPIRHFVEEHGFYAWPKRDYRLTAKLKGK